MSGKKSIRPYRRDADRRVRQAGRLARILRLLELIQSRGRWNQNAIARELECSERTVYRDLQVLEFAGVPWRFDPEEKCYRVRPDFRFPVVGLSEEELIGQSTATSIAKVAGRQIAQAAQATSRKLAATLPESARQVLADAEELISVLDFQLIDQTGLEPLIRTAQKALIQNAQLIGRYRSPYETEDVGLTLDPYRLCLLKQTWYLIGRPIDSDNPRTYRLSRFKSLKLSNKKSSRPKDFDLQAYFGNAWTVFRGQPTYKVKIEFDSTSGPTVSETTWHQTQKVHQCRDGRVILEFQIDGLNEILHWILSWGGHFKVVAPDALRTLVLENLQQALNCNQAP